jgi:hypothetical protein
MTEVSSSPVVEGHEIINPKVEVPRVEVPEGNGAVPDEGEIFRMQVDQAQMLAQAFAELKQCQERVQQILIAMGLSGMDIVSGNLEAENPHLIVKKANNIVT